MKKSKNILRIEKWLSKIGYSLRHHGTGHWYIYDHKGESTNWYIFGEFDTRIELAAKKDYQQAAVFYLKEIVPYALKTDGKVDCVGFYAKGNKSVFLQFYNH